MAAITAGSKARAEVSLRDLCLYFLKLGAFGFGGPIALAGYMQRDLQEERKWLTRDEYLDGLAIAQAHPGPLAAQLAMWIGYIRHGVLGSALVGLVFTLPPFIIVVAVAALYVALQGLPQIRALFYGIGPAIIAIITLSAWKLAKTTDGKDLKLWVISVVLVVVTAVTRAELAWLFLLAGAAAIFIYAPPVRLPWSPQTAAPEPRTSKAEPASSPNQSELNGFLPFSLGSLGLAGAITGGTLLTLLAFFLKASLFTFGSGLAIVPFLHEGVVDTYHWLNERQFLDAVAMGIISPGPVVITAAFVGYLVGGLAGASVAAFAVFFPVFIFDIVSGPIFLRFRENRQVRAFVTGMTAAAVGAIGGAAIVLGEGAVVDIFTAAIFVVALPLLYFKKLKEPYIVGLAGIAGLVADAVGLMPLR